MRRSPEQRAQWYPSADRFLPLFLKLLRRVLREARTVAGGREGKTGLRRGREGGRGAQKKWYNLRNMLSRFLALGLVLAASAAGQNPTAPKRGELDFELTSLGRNASESTITAAVKATNKSTSSVVFLLLLGKPSAVDSVEATDMKVALNVATSTGMKLLTGCRVLVAIDWAKPIDGHLMCNLGGTIC